MFGRTTSGFGGFGGSSTAGALPFGLSATNNNATSPFGGASASTGGGIFGASGNTGNSSGFVNSGTSAFGAPATSSAFGANNSASGGMFGSTNNASPFGASNSTNAGGFGASNTGTLAFGSGTTGGGLFGSSAAKPGFGGGFGTPTNNSVTPFGAAGSTFGGSATDPNVNNGTAGTPFTPYSEKDGNVTLFYQNLACMPEYKNFSFEELRLKDYEQNRRYGTGNPAPAGGFGASGSAFGQQNNTSAFGANTGSGFGLNTSAFGANNTNATGGTSAFGAPANNTPFGASNNTAFGANNNTSAFGAANNTNSPFGGANNASSGFGSTGTNAFGGGSAFGASKPSAFGALNTGSAFGSNNTTGGGLFGSNNNAANNSSPFGANNNTSAFGANNNTSNSPFGGANNTSSGFGAANNSPFGGNNASTAGGGLFGANNNNNNAFGSNNNSNTSAFGANNNASGGLFGGNQNNSGNAFGAKPATGGLFGSTNNNQGGFGATANNNSGGGLFGAQSNTNNNNTAGGLFGAKPAAQTGGLFGGNTQNNTQNNTGGLFGGNNNQTNASGGLFGAKPAAPTGGLFGGQNSTSSNFGQAQNNTSGGLFGSKPAAGTTGPSGGLFGGNNTTGASGGLFGGQNNTSNNSGGGLFGNNTNNTAGSGFGSGSTGGGLFGNKAPASSGTQGTGGLFGGSGSNTGTGGLFGSSQNNQQQQQSQNSLANIGAQNPYGNNPLFQSINGTQAGNLAQNVPLAVPTKGTKKAVTLGSAHKLPPLFRASAAVYKAEFSHTPGLRKTLFLTGVEKKPTNKEDEVFSDKTDAAIISSAIFSPKPSFRKLVVDKAKAGDAAGLVPSSESQYKPPKQVSFVLNNGEGAEIEGQKENEAPETAHVAQLEAPAVKPTTPITSVSKTAPPVDAEVDDDGYWMSPPLSVLKKKSLSELRSVANFKVGRKYYGEIAFKEPVDLSSQVNLDDIGGSIVIFGTRTVLIYPDDEAKPKAGEGLNLPATITLEGCYPINKADKLAILDPASEVVKKHIAKLKALDGMEFIGYVPSTGSWTFGIGLW